MPKQFLKCANGLRPTLEAAVQAAAPHQRITQRPPRMYSTAQPPNDAVTAGGGLRCAPPRKQRKPGAPCPASRSAAAPNLQGNASRSLRPSRESAKSIDKAPIDGTPRPNRPCPTYRKSHRCWPPAGRCTDRPSRHSQTALKPPLQPHWQSQLPPLIFG